LRIGQIESGCLDLYKVGKLADESDERIGDPLNDSIRRQAYDAIDLSCP